MNLMLNYLKKRKSISDTIMMIHMMKMEEIQCFMDIFIPGFGIKMNLRSLYILLLKCHHMPAFNIYAFYMDML